MRFKTLKGNLFPSFCSSRLPLNMASFSSHRDGSSNVYPSAADPFVSRECLTARRTAIGDNSGDVQLAIDELEAGLAGNVTGLRKQVRNLKDVGEDFESEANHHKNFINQLERTLTNGRLGMKNNISRLNGRVVKEQSKHVMHVVLFTILCFLAVYIWLKFLRR